MGTLSLMYLEVHMGKESHNRKKTPVRKAFGLKVRMRRFEIGITQEELAEPMLDRLSVEKET